MATRGLEDFSLLGATANFFNLLAVPPTFFAKITDSPWFYKNDDLNNHNILYLSGNKPVMNYFDDAIFTLGEDQWIECQLDSMPRTFVNNSLHLGLHIEGPPQTDEDLAEYIGCLLTVSASFAKVRFIGRIGGVAKEFTATIGDFSTAAGDTMRLELTGGMQIGGVMEMFHNDISLASHTLIAGEIPGQAGQPGLVGGSTVGPGERVRMLPVTAGDFLSGAPAPGYERSLLRTLLVRSGLLRPSMIPPHEMDDFV